MPSLFGLTLDIFSPQRRQDKDSQPLATVQFHELPPFFCFAHLAASVLR